jgi:TRAP-type mannitol/chloroaromatic compound transport system substrate-binding protein
MTTTRRTFLPDHGALAGAAALAAPAVPRADRADQVADADLCRGRPGRACRQARHRAFNKIAAGQMEIELYFADQLVPTSELFQAMQAGTIDACSRMTIQHGLADRSDRVRRLLPPGAALFAGRAGAVQPIRPGAIWEEEYAKVGVSTSRPGPGIPATSRPRKPINSLADLKGKRIFTFPTAGRFLAQFGVVPVHAALGRRRRSRCRPASWTGWPGRASPRSTRWAGPNVTKYFLTNNISGAWIGHFFANMERWNALPPHLQELLRGLLRAVALLPPVVVLGRRGRPAGERRQAATDHDPRCGMGRPWNRTPR